MSGWMWPSTANAANAASTIPVPPDSQITALQIVSAAVVLGLFALGGILWLWGEAAKNRALAAPTTPASAPNTGPTTTMVVSGPMQEGLKLLERIALSLELMIKGTAAETVKLSGELQTFREEYRKGNEENRYRFREELSKAGDRNGEQLHELRQFIDVKFEQEAAERRKDIKELEDRLRQVEIMQGPRGGRPRGS